jgi:hypothetical protein
MQATLRLSGETVSCEVRDGTFAVGVPDLILADDPVTGVTLLSRLQDWSSRYRTAVSRPVGGDDDLWLLGRELFVALDESS